MSTLTDNEAREAAAFDTVAGEVRSSALSTSAWTFRRYREASAGSPLFRMYPDLVFEYIGKRIGKDIGTSDKPLNGLKVLDLGAGDGVWSVILAEQGASVTSIEISPKQVELARARMAMHGLKWEARVASAYNLTEDLDQKSFDLVFGQGVLHHLVMDLNRVAKGIAWVLKPSGIAVFTEPYSGSPFIRALRERLAFAIPLDKESPDERPLTESDIQLLARHFHAVEVAYADVLAKVGRRMLKSESLTRALGIVDRYAVKIQPLRALASLVFLAFAMETHPKGVN